MSEPDDLAPTTEESLSWAGEAIGPIVVERPVGRGAMGTVYRARHKEKGTVLAIKCLSPSLIADANALARFEREAAVLKQLKHPNIVRLFGTGKKHHTPFLIMEFIEGKTLQQMLRQRGRFQWDEVVEIGKQVCAALQHAHDKSIIHRDLKPSNLMYTADGTVKLTDFGIAKPLDLTQLTADHHTLGTAAYMSPEQCWGKKDLTNKSDLYALGVVLYELLTGQTPFQADNALIMFRMHIEARIERPSKLALDTPVWLDTLICQLMEKKTDKRPRDAVTVAQVLGEVHEKVATLHSAGVEAAGKALRRSHDEEEKEAARALLEARRKRRSRRSESGFVRGAWLYALTLGLLLLVTLGVLVYALWPAGPEERFARAMQLVQQGEALADQGDFDNALVKWYDAEHRYLLGLAEGGGPYADRAREQLDYLHAGTLYVRGMVGLNRAGWPEAKTRGFDELLDNYPADNRFAEKARSRLQFFEAPKLLEQGRRLASPRKKKEDWEAARYHLNLLLRRYPANEQAEPARRILERLDAHEKALAKLDEARRTGRPALGLNNAEQLALEALDLEHQEQADKARAKWEELKGLGQKPGAMEDPQVRPWVQLAEEKLRPPDEEKPPRKRK